jgi:aspartate/methionine/tyrosine aminotransferase
MRPDGAFYGFLHVEGLTNSHDFAIDLIKKVRVGVAPGTAFGDAGDSTLESYIRICFAQDPKLLETGLDRLGKAVAEL